MSRRMKICPNNSEELQKALDEALSGTKISLHPIKYIGDFSLNSKAQVTISGTSDIYGNRACISGSRKAFTLQSNNCTIENLTIEGSSVGLEIKGVKNSVRSLTIKNNVCGIMIKGNRNEVSKSSISDVEKGIVIQGDGNKIKNCRSLRSSTNGISIEGNSSGTQILNCSTFSLLLEEGSSKCKIWNCSVNGGGAYVQGCGHEIKNLNGTGQLEVYGDWNGSMVHYNLPLELTQGISATFSLNANNKKVSYTITDFFNSTTLSSFCDL